MSLRYPALSARVRRPLLGALILCGTALPARAQFGNAWLEFSPGGGSLAAPPTAISSPNTEVDFAWGDLDQDGWTDLVVVRKEPFTTSGRRTNRLLMNELGVLRDRTGLYATASDVAGDDGFYTPTNDRDVVLTDVDLDGWLDVVTATTLSDGAPKSIGHPRVYRNLGSGGPGAWQGLRYEEARFPQLFQYDNGTPQNPSFCGVAAGDVTGDGYPELYFADYDGGVFIPEPPFQDLNDRLLVNDGSGFFTDESQLRMTETMLQSDFGSSAEICDVNLDGVQDILKNSALIPPYPVTASYNDPSNEGTFNLYDPFHVGFNSYHMELGDLNNDGRPDLLVSQDAEDRYRYNLGVDAFGRVVWGPPMVFQFLAQADDGFASNNLIADLDGDGWNDAITCDVDLDVPGYNRRIHIYHNPGGAVGEQITLREERQTPAGGGWLGAVGLLHDDLEAGHDAAVFDLDNDGDNELILGRKDGTFVWINQTVPNLLLADVPEMSLATGGARNALSKEALTQPAGFQGVNGVFRFLPNGSNERGLAVATIQDKQVKVLSPAPQGFEGAGF